MLLSLADGRRGLVTVAKQLTHEVVSGQRRVEDIIPSHVDTVIQGDDATTSNSTPCFCQSCLVVYNFLLHIINIQRSDYLQMLCHLCTYILVQETETV